MHADPAYQARRLAGLSRYYDQPGVRERHGRRFDVHRANMSNAERQRRSEHGKRLVRDYLSRPDVIAKARSPEAQLKKGASCTAKKLGWCPPHLRDAYRALLRKHFTAAEARQLIEAEIPDTVEHAKRVVANNELKMRLRDERRRADAY